MLNFHPKASTLIPIDKDQPVKVTQEDNFFLI